MCFVTWNFAVKVLGAVKTSVYIYLVPVITVLCSVVVLHETISTRAALGILLTLVGLLLSEMNNRKKLELLPILFSSPSSFPQSFCRLFHL